MIEFIKTITESELRFIASLDYGRSEEEHYGVLNRLIFHQEGLLNSDQSWYPYEVIELGANWLQPEHEREYVICTLLVIKNVIAGRDLANELDLKFKVHASEYDKLPGDCRDEILKAYEKAMF